MFKLGRRMALVSGAGRGMGFGVAQTLARQGATVIINDFYAERAEAATQTLRDGGLKADAATAGMTDRAALFAMLQPLLAKHGAIDVFVHSAGIPAQRWGYSQFLEPPPAE